LDVIEQRKEELLKFLLSDLNSYCEISKSKVHGNSFCGPFKSDKVERKEGERKRDQLAIPNIGKFFFQYEAPTVV